MVRFSFQLCCTIISYKLSKGWGKWKTTKTVVMVSLSKNDMHICAVALCPFSNYSMHQFMVNGFTQLCTVKSWPNEHCFISISILGHRTLVITSAATVARLPYLSYTYRCIPTYIYHAWNKILWPNNTWNVKRQSVVKQNWFSSTTVILHR